MKAQGIDGKSSRVVPTASPMAAPSKAPIARSMTTLSACGVDEGT